MSSDKKQGFEASLERLEALVGELERGELPLEEALAAYEEGMKLARLCQKRLDSAEKRIEKIATPSGDEEA
ncbi:Exodeoxyribonuclease VII small subunit [Magnetococcus marinus MC-1]|uniref:Exodeoxyribonuclease 7 small subunit n=1 Tax=Magnetococcus marinus (strain ATCC BAA-1437 / JCM 17883 / MC-1) TaxID=156889 RepID=EX7S_MAGMM|nr:exodeoxyribonuclease VII small subunit [Magnetococcus marinus]A0L6H5.1 RecName: Full=Exodeoxyribonuclease 7 small subunit; AltName: Full=Exodeoxyribonuclease VII small subunit; Short=Exonuclease VII small subunit [Magnetococcus marinus MC-1]ABK43568.1 Exodeoxyribonuclease VII small subunit [Magnetococcus marinus MC-1]